MMVFTKEGGKVPYPFLQNNLYSDSALQALIEVRFPTKFKIIMEQSIQESLSETNMFNIQAKSTLLLKYIMWRPSKKKLPLKTFHRPTICT